MRVVVSSDSSETRDLYRQVALNHGLECRSEDCVPFDGIAFRLGQGQVDLVLIGLVNGNGAGAALEAVRVAARTHPLVLAAGPTHDAPFILEALRHGATEFLDQAQPREELARALGKLKAAGRIQLRSGRLLAVTGVLAGSGVTTVASGLAFALAAVHKPTALVELDPIAPELALDLNLPLKNTVTQILQEWQRVDLRILQQAGIEHAGGAFVLANEPGQQIPALEPDAYRMPVSLLRRAYDWSVLDLGHAPTAPGTLDALRLAETVVLVVRLDVPSVRLSRGLIKRLDELGIPPERICAVANRYGQAGQLPWRKAEEALGVKFRVWIPDNPRIVNDALNNGQAVAQWAPRSKLARRFAELATAVSGPRD